MLFGESKISYKGLSFVHEYVSKLHISVDESSLRNMNQPTHNILHDLKSFLLVEPSFLLKHTAKITLITKLSDNEAVAGLPDHIIAFENIVMA